MPGPVLPHAPALVPVLPVLPKPPHSCTPEGHLSPKPSGSWTGLARCLTGSTPLQGRRPAWVRGALRTWIGVVPLAAVLLGLADVRRPGLHAGAADPREPDLGHVPGHELWEVPLGGSAWITSAAKPVKLRAMVRRPCLDSGSADGREPDLRHVLGHQLQLLVGEGEPGRGLDVP